MSPTYVVHLHKQPYDVLIDRSTRWGNPFTHIQDRKTAARFVVPTRRDALAAFEIWVNTSDDLSAIWIRQHVHELRGKTLGCWCAPDRPCHGEILAAMAERTPPGKIYVPPPHYEQDRFF